MFNLTRRHFIKAGLAASALLAVPALRLRTGSWTRAHVNLPLIYTSLITEGKFEEYIIDEHCLRTTYYYDVDLTYAAPQRPDQVWLDGRPTEHPWTWLSGSLVFTALPLGPYGNRIPEVTALYT
jgi:hypothetical protein